MKILVIADEPCKALWDYFDKKKLEGVDLILSAGDLPPEYLSFLVTFSNCPVLYVHGNHDDKYAERPPEGCICIDDELYVYEGIRFMGLGGSYRYTFGDHQYTENEMKRRLKKLRLKIRAWRGVDVLLTHAPALGINDQDDMPHRGFKTFQEILDEYCPKFMVHGHVHMNYGYQIPRETAYNHTTIINAYERYVFEIDSPTKKHPWWVRNRRR